MLRPLRRLPLRRCIHTSQLRPQHAFSRSKKLGVAVGATSLAVYFAWHLSSENQRIRLDAHSSASAKQVPLVPKTTAPSSADFTTPSSHSDTSRSAREPPSLPPSEPLDGPEPSLTGDDTPDSGSASDLEEAESSGGAFNPVTGEINWDCSCLGGMAYGPCGQEFREAFSCFVYSDKEPKGIECVEKFRNMQDCFRAHPDVYGDDIMDDDEDGEETSGVPTSDTQNPDTTPLAQASSDPTSLPPPAPSP